MKPIKARKAQQAKPTQPHRDRSKYDRSDEWGEDEDEPRNYRLMRAFCRAAPTPEEVEHDDTDQDQYP